MQSKQFCALTTTKSRAKIRRQLDAFKAVVLVLLFYVPPLFCGGSVFVFVLVCITLCPF